MKRKSFVVDEGALRPAKRALGVATDSEAIRQSVQRIAEVEAFRRFVRGSRGTLKPGSLRMP